MDDTRKAWQQLGRRIGQQIAECRKALAWSQAQLTERLEVDTVSRFEHGATIPSLVTKGAAFFLQPNVAFILLRV